MEKFLISIITIATIYIYMFWLMLMNAASYFILSGFGIDNKATMDRNMEDSYRWITTKVRWLPDL